MGHSKTADIFPLLCCRCTDSGLDIIFQLSHDSCLPVETVGVKQIPSLRYGMEMQKNLRNGKFSRMAVCRTNG